MNIETENYQQACRELPGAGQQIIGYQTAEEIVVYQAYKPSIAAFAVANQILGGNAYSYNRMSWIKPNFLWMMYRCGWAEKENQERVLAIWTKKSVLKEILENAAISSFNSRYHPSHDAWKKELETKEARLQWDPDHDPYGRKLERRAIQLGLKGQLLENFGKKQITRIEDITDFVKEQKHKLDNHKLEELIVPVERIWEINDTALQQRIGIDTKNGNSNIIQAGRD